MVWDNDFSRKFYQIQTVRENTMVCGYIDMDHKIEINRIGTNVIRNMNREILYDVTHFLISTL